jgi:hypothetical protein
MKHSFRLFLLVCSLSSLVLADQVTLKNGDIISGQIEKKDGDSLLIKTEFMGEVTIPWNAVTAVKSDNPLYVKLPSGQEVSGKVSTEGTNVEVATPTAPQTAPIGQVDTIRNAVEQAKYERFLHPSWLDLWAGYADLGFSLARGNAKATTLTTAFNAVRATTNDKTTLFFNQIYSTGTVNQGTPQESSGATANAARGGISYDHNINSRWFWNVLNTDEYDQFQGLNFRFLAGAGVGFHAINNKRTTLDLVAGGDYSHSSFVDGTIRNLGEIYLGDDFTHKVTGVTSVNQSLRFFIAPSTGEYRILFNAGAATVIHKWLSWQVGVTDSYLSNPILGRKSNDILLTTGLRATFAR